jgi:hypothetical protein
MVANLYHTNLIQARACSATFTTASSHVLVVPCHGQLLYKGSASSRSRRRWRTLLRQHGPAHSSTEQRMVLNLSHFQAGAVPVFARVLRETGGVSTSTPSTTEPRATSPNPL